MSEAATKPDKPVARVRCVLRMGGLTDLERLVMVALACYDGEKGAYPTIAQLADAVARPRWAVTRILGTLRDKGAIRTRRSQRYNFYTVNYRWPIPFQKAEPVRHLPEGGDSPPSGASVPESDGGRSEAQMADRLRHRKGERDRSAPPASPAEGQAAGALPESVPGSLRRDVAVVTVNGRIEIHAPTKFMRECLAENHLDAIADHFAVAPEEVEFVTGWRRS